MTVADASTAVVGVAALCINVHAGVALVQGLRAREAAVVARHAWRCTWSVGAFALLFAAALALSLPAIGALPVESHSGASERATRLAMTISALMNGVAFGVPVLLFPCLAAVLLHVRARRARS